ncbi:MAG: hypothetical protein HY741_10860 [Chloroflexi bacterium]|nr:hypothetical protein [Chloroflexota bacterium]
MKTKWFKMLGAAVAAGIIGVVVFGAVASAQAPTPNPTPNTQPGGFGFWRGMRGGFGMHGGFGFGMRGGYGFCSKRLWKTRATRSRAKN